MYVPVAVVRQARTQFTSYSFRRSGKSAFLTNLVAWRPGPTRTSPGPRGRPTTAGHSPARWLRHALCSHRAGSLPAGLRSGASGAQWATVSRRRGHLWDLDGRGRLVSSGPLGGRTGTCVARRRGLFRSGAGAGTERTACDVHRASLPGTDPIRPQRSPRGHSLGDHGYRLPFGRPGGAVANSRLRVLGAANSLGAPSPHL